MDPTYYQPIATVIAAIAAVSVTTYFAWQQRKLTQEQARIAKEKLRLDLYDRRFRVFTSIFDFYDAMISWDGTPEQRKARDAFFRAYQESGFLFSKESGIQQTLKELNDAAAKVIGFKEHGEHLRPDPELFLKKFNETNDIQTRVFEEGLSKLGAAMHEYLDFSRI